MNPVRVCCVLALHAARAFGQSPGAVTATGNLILQRGWHIATLLTTGKVLIAGGKAILPGLPVWNSAELYDPATGTFTSTGSMNTPRYLHTATLLPNGKVLITGGFKVSPIEAAADSAELYDPSTGSFTATGDMTTYRAGHTATLLNNGLVLIAGGARLNAPPDPFVNYHLNTAELYDPSSGAFTATGDMLLTRSGGTATLLPDGKVILDGGDVNSEFPYNTAEVYDPPTGTFSKTGPSAYPSLFPTSASPLTNGKVLVTLEFSCDPDDQAEVYDPSDRSFAATGNMTSARGYITSTLLPDGKVLIAGEGSSAVGLGSAELYDPVVGTFSSNMVTRSRQGHTATLLPDGTVLLAGGWLCCGYTVNTADTYHPAILTPSPVLFSVSADAQGAILHGTTQQLVSPDNPAVAGEALEVFGAVLVDGAVIPPQVFIGGRMAEVLFFGEAPGYAGLNQVNVLVPAGISLGPAVPVRLRYLNRPSNEVTIAVR